MIEENFSKNILQKIKSTAITPKPKWQFRLKNYILWLSFTITILVGGISTSIIIYMARHNGWLLFGRFNGFFFIKTIPYFWLIILALFILLAYYNFRNLEGGYKYKFELVVLASIVLSIILGLVFYNFGLTERLERGFERKLPFYKEAVVDRLDRQHRQLWLSPDYGFLGGKVILIEGHESFTLEGFDRRLWSISQKKAEFSRPGMEEGVFLKIIGRRIGEDQFEAERINFFEGPWLEELRFPGGMMKENFYPRRINR
ncbi:MAG: hypothetical protein COU22_02805 [Candidatus Komeilibacteria bacterium CG10_big_fil_rev_8_21_14_0_10_41_13]|uniref:Uncharacterized protein n=1 Tax=Candidatus Komeilibacteria bacterium CG10_big_fil_rev_8_21_14_0_10_41_13 TaxID=1974476 RepID=A0A2M6WC00_9BACT|nr:MAG: hypothetical protein COU22_02805 [Candidatus Komeilibacteria bacterium CG10_big_fil_rev_8_21_14_0_10_41_13]